jgi:hypothetical protein
MECCPFFTRYSETVPEVKTIFKGRKCCLSCIFNGITWGRTRLRGWSGCRWDQNTGWDSPPLPASAPGSFHPAAFSTESYHRVDTLEEKRRDNVKCGTFWLAITSTRLLCKCSHTQTKNLTINGEKSMARIRSRLRIFRIRKFWASRIWIRIRNYL